jgi:CheY-like chemotaxis protein
MNDANEITDRSELKDVILIVDDDDISRKLLSIMVKNLGFRTLCVEDGQYLTFSCEYFLHIKAILLDMNMPKLDGYKTAQKLKKLFKRMDQLDIPPIVAVTGDDNKEKCLKAGCDGYVKKPIVRDQLAQTLREVGLNPTQESGQSHRQESEKSL